MSDEDRLNLFEPWEGAAAHHENRLTRALLIVLRYSPLAHQSWLGLVQRPLPIELRRELHELEEPTYATQRRRVLSKSSEGEEPVEGISVLIAGDNQAYLEQSITERDGTDQVLDGIVEYGKSRVIVIESKLTGPVATQQHLRINRYGQPIDWIAPPVPISWGSLVAAFSDLASRGLVAPAEREVLMDFLDMVDRHFPRIGPYTTLARCMRQPFRLQKRLARVMDDIRDESGGTHVLNLPDRAAVRQAHLALDRYPGGAPSVALRMWPADTMNQAKTFYRQPSAVRALLDLRDEGWTIEPNLHLSYVSTGVTWLSAAAQQPVDDYADFWQQAIADLHQVRREGFEDFWATMTAAGLADDADRPKFVHDFVHSNRKTLNPCPGLAATYRWSLEEAEELDNSPGGFASAVKRRINEVLVALDEPPLA